MRYQTFPKSSSTILRGSRGRTRAILGSISTGRPKVALTVPRHAEMMPLASLKAPIIHYGAPRVDPGFPLHDLPRPLALLWSPSQTKGSGLPVKSDEVISSNCLAG